LVVDSVLDPTTFGDDIDVDSLRKTDLTVVVVGGGGDGVAVGLVVVVGRTV